MSRASLSGESLLGEPEPGSDAAALAKLRGHWLLPAVGKPAAAAVLAELKVQRITDGKAEFDWQRCVTASGKMASNDIGLC